ncbi:hypothetical protein [Rickettsiales endosymbiont of Peranema trichophorum]|uniref:hypothetical protein n=1 Tax=Rickettsiales endosymbiont of Peranema trichophorum TaxID=2486577 RepID=UPI001A931F31|nr:hypothetical protein [Rickettsiales endosymbiont of Peranema trichophorum]
MLRFVGAPPVAPNRIEKEVLRCNECVKEYAFNHDLHIDYSDCEGEYKFRAMEIKMHAGIGYTHGCTKSLYARR